MINFKQTKINPIPEIHERIMQHSNAYQSIGVLPPPFRLTEIEHYQLCAYLLNNFYPDPKETISTYYDVPIEVIKYNTFKDAFDAAVENFYGALYAEVRLSLSLIPNDINKHFILNIVHRMDLLKKYLLGEK